jgi:hypothetical protein
LIDKKNKTINLDNKFENNDINTAFDFKGAEITNLNNYFAAENILTNLFFKSYFDFRSRKGKSLDITIFKLIRGIFYSVSALFLIFTIAIFFLARNNILSAENSTNSILFTFCISLALALATFFHYKIENEFEKNKDILKLELKDSDKGRFYFKIDCVLFIVVFISIIFI